MKTPQTLITVLVLFWITGCGKRNEIPLPEGPKESTRKEEHRPNFPREALGKGDGNEIGSFELREWERKYQWDRQKIVKHHKLLALAELPDYIGEVWGAGGKPKDGDILSDWAFVVPQDRITEFHDYLQKLGVPAEYMNADSPYRASDREDWKAPEPPAEKLNFLMAETQKADGVSKGLKFKGGQSRLYTFENPNLERSELHIRFDSVTGNTHVEERYIGW